MTKERVKTYSIIILLAALLVTAFFLFRKPPPEVIVKPGPTTPEIVIKEKSDSARFKKTIDSLVVENKNLKKEKVQDEKDLKEVSDIAADLSDKLEQALDTSASAEIKAQFQALKVAQEKKDSAHAKLNRTQDSTIANLEEQNRVKDSASAALRSSYNAVVSNSEYDNKVIIPGLKKEAKSERRGKRFWQVTTAIGAVIIVGQTFK